jgi:hypothetical protein
VAFPDKSEWRLTIGYIQVRIIFRLVEFGPGVSRDNPVLTNENFVFGLDALPMVIALGLLNIFHPGLVLRGSDSEFPRLTRKEKTARKQEKKERANENRKLKQTQSININESSGHQMIDSRGPGSNRPDGL